MDKQDHNDLYDELKEVITQRGINVDTYTETQRVFAEALESASFGSELLGIYTDLVEDTPDIPVRKLHAFIIGIALGQSGHTLPLDSNKTHH